jgi:hypothetical protein
MTMIVIGYDRYNVIVKGFTGTKITSKKVSSFRLPSSAMITYTAKTGYQKFKTNIPRK